MRFFNKYFFTGMALGVVLTLVMIPLAAYVGVHLFLKPYAQERISKNLSPPPLPSVNHQQIDYDWTIFALDGEPVQLAEFRGKPIFLNLWATWCQPCVAEMPSIQHLYEKFKTDEIVFLIVSVEGPDQRAELRKFAADHDYGFDIYLADKERPAVFRTEGIPTTFIIDREGNIVFQHTGSARWDDAACVEFLRELL